MRPAWNGIRGKKVTAGNVHDSVAWDEVYEQTARRFPEIQYVTMDAGYKQPWIAKRILEDGRLPHPSVHPPSRHTPGRVYAMGLFPMRKKTTG